MRISGSPVGGGGSGGSSGSRFTPIDAQTQIEWSFDTLDAFNGQANLGHGGALTLKTGWAANNVQPATGQGGIFNRAWSLNGTQGLSTPDTSIGEAATAWSVVGWFYVVYAPTNQAQTPELFDKKYQTGNTWAAPFTSCGAFMIPASPGDWKATLTIGGTAYIATPNGDGASNNPITGAGKIPEEQWTMVTLTYDGTTFRVYLNDSLVAFNANMPPNSPIDWGQHGAWQLGAVTTQAISGLTGSLDEFRMYSRVLSPSDVSAMFKGGVNRRDP